MKKINDINELRKIQINILKYIHDICEKNNLSYFLCGGTLLGAIRHKGYIPWDDDIDIMMPVKDYEKMIKIINSDKRSPYRMYTYKNFPGYYHSFGKVTDTGTIYYTCIQQLRQLKNLGISIEVFPYINIPDSKSEAEKLLRRVDFYRKWLLGTVRLNSSEGVNRVKYVLKWTIPIIFFLCNCIDHTSKRYRLCKSGKVAVINTRFREKEIINRSAYSKRELAEFENEMFYIPSGYDKYLTNLYGDYMKLPPVSQQKWCHSFRAWRK